MLNGIRAFFLAILAVGEHGLLVSAQAEAEKTTTAAGYAEVVQPFFQTYCLRCHNQETQEGNFRLDTLEHDFANQSVSQRWGEVVFRMNADEMPPEEVLQPQAEELGQVVDWISARIKEGETTRMAQRGPVALYRLSREEYANTVYDLLGVFFDVNQPGAFNEDPRWHGYERIGSMLSLSPSHVDRYFRAAEVVLERAFPEHSPQVIKKKIDAIEMWHRNRRQELEQKGIADRVRVPIWPEGSVPAFRPYWFGQVKGSGLYRARIQLSGLRGMDGRAPHLSIWNSKLKRTIYDEDILAPEDKPTVIELELFLDMPVELEFQNVLPSAFPQVGNHTLNVLNMGGGLFLSSKATEYLNPTGYKLMDEAGNAIYPLLLVDWVEWEGPILSESDLKKRDGVIPKQADDLEEARQCLQRFASRAWRRPATDKEVERYLQIIQKELAAGEKCYSAYRAALVGILTSKNFYYLVEGSATERRNHLNDWELASRLSYFLWGSMPDDELLTVAASGTLRQPEVLRAQLQRMLADGKIKRFTEAFPKQWLQLYKVGMFPPDQRLYPDYDLWLEKSMVLETTSFFNEVFTQNLSLREFLTSNWTIVNPRLALHYQLPPLASSGLQKVKLRPEDHRGGLLTQASILMLTSDGTRHRPVHRGVWVSESIFGRTPPPPPPNVEPLAPTPVNEPKATIRQQLQAHASHATCASCHQKIDPLGFAFENFDAIGRWRTHERIEKGVGADPIVDPTGKLPDGRSFHDAEEFKLLLAEDLDRFAEVFVEQLAIFALRRAMTIDDADDIQQITADSRAKDYALQTVLENFVLSNLFQQR